MSLHAALAVGVGLLVGLVVFIVVNDLTHADDANSGLYEIEGDKWPS